MSEHGTALEGWDKRGRAPEEPRDTVWRLRSRACWQEAAELLRPAAEHDPTAALGMAELLIEQCLFTASHWQQAEQALRLAEAGVSTTEQRAAASCARGFLAYVASVLGPRDRLDEAQAALAEVSTPTEAARMRSEASRLVQALGGVPVWLARQLSTLPAAGAPPDGRIGQEAGGAIS